MIRATSSGDHKKTARELDRLRKSVGGGTSSFDFNRYGKMGVDALARATPVDTSLTRNSWEYRIIKDRKNPGIEWYNTNVVNGIPVAILIQYGHGTGTGGYVVGRDYINPAMLPIFDMIADEIWKKVKL